MIEIINNKKLINLGALDLLLLLLSFEVVYFNCNFSFILLIT